MVAKAFSMPTVMKIIGRTSSITNAFANAIIPVIEPTEEQIHQALDRLGMSRVSLCCAYCGDPCTEWDHFRPLIKDKRPTGYISEIDNLVPSCGKCNQSKGNKDWKVWILSSAPRSPASRNVPDLALRVSRLEAYEAFGRPTKIEFEAILGAEAWRDYWAGRDKIFAQMRACQIQADLLKSKILEAESHL